MSSKYTSLSGQSVLVTGGASGIGRCCAQAFAEQGCKIVVADRSVDHAEMVTQELLSQGKEAVFVGGDVASSDDADAMIAKAFNAFGGLQVVVHSAGVGVEKKLLETTDEEWGRLINIDLTGSFYIMRAAGRAMKPSGYGRIIMLSSTAGIRGGTGRAAYGAAKGGVISLTQVAAVELATTGITVNALAPGAIETELVAKMHSEATRVNYRRSIPMDRYGTPEEVASAAVFWQALMRATLPVLSCPLMEVLPAAALSIAIDSEGCEAPMRCLSDLEGCQF